MAELYLFGVPLGFQNSACDADTANFLGLFYDGMNKNEMVLNITRRKNKVFYSFLVNEKPGHSFCDINGRPGSFFGMSLVFDNRYVTDTERLKKMFLAAYNKYVKDQIIQEFSNGNRKWLTENMDTAAKHVANGMQNLMRDVPELSLNNIVKPLPPEQPQNTQIRR